MNTYLRQVQRRWSAISRWQRMGFIAMAVLLIASAAYQPLSEFWGGWPLAIGLCLTYVMMFFPLKSGWRKWVCVAALLGGCFVTVCGTVPALRDYYFMTITPIIGVASMMILAWNFAVPMKDNS